MQGRIEAAGVQGVDRESEFLLAKWEYASLPPVIFNSDNVFCLMGCSSAFRIEEYRFTFDSPKYFDEAIKILNDQNVQIETITRAKGKTFLGNFGADEVLHKQRIYAINQAIPSDSDCWNGYLILTDEGIYLFSGVSKFKESRHNIDNLYPHQFTEEYLLGYWSYSDPPHISICGILFGMRCLYTRIDGYSFRLQGRRHSKRASKILKE